MKQSMTQSIVRSRAMITRTLSRTACEEIADGAILQSDGIITAIGTFAELSAGHPDVPVIGDGDAIMLPGFVNAHHHVGLTPVQLGSPDMPLELWFVTRLVMRSVDLYLDTLYSAFEMIASGVTTVQHIQSALPGSASEVHAKVEPDHQGLRRHRDAGVLLLRGARPEPARLPGRRGVRCEPAERAAGAAAAPFRALPAHPRRHHGFVPRPFTASTPAGRA